MRLRPWEIAILVGAAAVGTLFLRQLQVPRADLPAYRTEWTADTVGARSQRQAVLVFLGDIECGVCTTDEFKTELVNTLGRFERVTREQGLVPYLIGVTFSYDTSAALDYLGGLWAWAEVSSGGGWLNTFAIQRVWEGGVEPVTPTVLLFERTIVQQSGRYLVRSRTRLRPLVGRSVIASLSDSDLRQIYPRR